VDITDIPAEIVPVLMQALTLAREHRTASAAAFASALAASSARS